MEGICEEIISRMGLGGGASSDVALETSATEPTGPYGGAPPPGDSPSFTRTLVRLAPVAHAARSLALTVDAGPMFLATAAVIESAAESAWEAAAASAGNPRGGPETRTRVVAAVAGSGETLLETSFSADTRAEFVRRASAALRRAAALTEAYVGPGAAVAPPVPEAFSRSTETGRRRPSAAASHAEEEARPREARGDDDDIRGPAQEPRPRVRGDPGVPAGRERLR